MRPFLLGAVPLAAALAAASAAALAVAAVPGASPAVAGAAPAAAPRLTAAPNPVSFGQAVIVQGREWPVFENCRRRVRLSLRSDQNAFVLGSAPVRANGRFTFRWTPRRSEVGAGAWRLVAVLRCESGEDGSPVLVRRAVPLHIGHGAAS
jgi:hypothetical protein